MSFLRFPAIFAEKRPVLCCKSRSLKKYKKDNYNISIIICSYKTKNLFFKKQSGTQGKSDIFLHNLGKILPFFCRFS